MLLPGSDAADTDQHVTHATLTTAAVTVLPQLLTPGGQMVSTI
jgi:hypothetical protein